MRNRVTREPYGLVNCDHIPGSVETHFVSGLPAPSLGTPAAPYHLVELPFHRSHSQNTSAISRESFVARAYRAVAIPRESKLGR